MRHSGNDSENYILCSVVASDSSSWFPNCEQILARAWDFINEIHIAVVCKFFSRIFFYNSFVFCFLSPSFSFLIMNFVVWAWKFIVQIHNLPMTTMTINCHLLECPGRKRIVCWTPLKIYGCSRRDEAEKNWCHKLIPIATQFLYLFTDRFTVASWFFPKNRNQ